MLIFFSCNLISFGHTVEIHFKKIGASLLDCQDQRFIPYRTQDDLGDFDQISEIGLQTLSVVGLLRQYLNFLFGIISYWKLTFVWSLYSIA